MNKTQSEYRFECIVNLKFILSVIFSVAVETVSFSVYIIIGYIQCYSETVSFSAVFILLSVIFSVTVETVSFSAVFILLSVIFSVTVETVSFSAVLVALKRAVGVSLQRRV